MKSGLKVLLAIGAVILILVISITSSYNNLVARSENVESAWSLIDVQLQRRYDLIPNLVATVRSMLHMKRGFCQCSGSQIKIGGAVLYLKLLKPTSSLGVRCLVY